MNQSDTLEIMNSTTESSIQKQMASVFYPESPNSCSLETERISFVQSFLAEAYFIATEPLNDPNYFVNRTSITDENIENLDPNNELNQDNTTSSTLSSSKKKNKKKKKSKQTSTVEVNDDNNNITNEEIQTSNYDTNVKDTNNIIVDNSTSSSSKKKKKKKKKKNANKEQFIFSFLDNSLQCFDTLLAKTIFRQYTMNELYSLWACVPAKNIANYINQIEAHHVAICIERVQKSLVNLPSRVFSNDVMKSYTISNNLKEKDGDLNLNNSDDCKVMEKFWSSLPLSEKQSLIEHAKETTLLWFRDQGQQDKNQNIDNKKYGLVYRVFYKELESALQTKSFNHITFFKLLNGQTEEDKFIRMARSIDNINESEMKYFTLIMAAKLSVERETDIDSEPNSLTMLLANGKCPPEYREVVPEAFRDTIGYEEEFDFHNEELYDYDNEDISSKDENILMNTKPCDIPMKQVFEKDIIFKTNLKQSDFEVTEVLDESDDEELNEIYPNDKEFVIKRSSDVDLKNLENIDNEVLDNEEQLAFNLMKSGPDLKMLDLSRDALEILTALESKVQTMEEELSSNDRLPVLDTKSLTRQIIDLFPDLSPEFKDAMINGMSSKEMFKRGLLKPVVVEDEKEQPDLCKEFNSVLSMSHDLLYNNGNKLLEAMQEIAKKNEEEKNNEVVIEDVGIENQHEIEEVVNIDANENIDIKEDIEPEYESIDDAEEYDESVNNVESNNLSLEHQSQERYSKFKETNSPAFLAERIRHLNVAMKLKRDLDFAISNLFGQRLLSLYKEHVAKQKEESLLNELLEEELQREKKQESKKLKKKQKEMQKQLEKTRLENERKEREEKERLEQETLKEEEMKRKNKEKLRKLEMEKEKERLRLAEEEKKRLAKEKEIQRKRMEDEKLISKKLAEEEEARRLEQIKLQRQQNAKKIDNLKKNKIDNEKSKDSKSRKNSGRIIPGLKNVDISILDKAVLTIDNTIEDNENVANKNNNSNTEELPLIAPAVESIELIDRNSTNSPAISLSSDISTQHSFNGMVGGGGRRSPSPQSVHSNITNVSSNNLTKKLSFNHLKKDLDNELNSTTSISNSISSTSLSSIGTINSNWNNGLSLDKIPMSSLPPGLGPTTVNRTITPPPSQPVPTSITQISSISTPVPFMASSISTPSSLFINSTLPSMGLPSPAITSSSSLSTTIPNALISPPCIQTNSQLPISATPLTNYAPIPQLPFIQPPLSGCSMNSNENINKANTPFNNHLFNNSFSAIPNNVQNVIPSAIPTNNKEMSEDEIQKRKFLESLLKRCAPGIDLPKEPITNDNNINNLSTNNINSLSTNNISNNVISSKPLFPILSTPATFGNSAVDAWSKQPDNTKGFNSPNLSLQGINNNVDSNKNSKLDINSSLFTSNQYLPQNFLNPNPISSNNIQQNGPMIDNQPFNMDLGITGINHILDEDGPDFNAMFKYF